MSRTVDPAPQPTQTRSVLSGLSRSPLSPLRLADFRTTDAAAAMVIVVIGVIMEWRTNERRIEEEKEEGRNQEEHLRVTCWQQLAHASIAHPPKT